MIRRLTSVPKPSSRLRLYISERVRDSDHGIRSRHRHIVQDWKLPLPSQLRSKSGWRKGYAVMKLELPHTQLSQEAECQFRPPCAPPGRAPHQSILAEHQSSGAQLASQSPKQNQV